MFDIEFNPKESFLKQELAVSGVFNNIIDPGTAFMIAQTVGSAAAGGFFGNDGSADREGRARKRALRLQGKETDRYNEDVHTYTVREGERRYEHALETVEIQRQNQDTQIALSQEQLNQQYSYGMDIRQFEYDQQVRLRDQQIQQAQEQIGFNQDAFLLGMKQQEVFKEEQELAIEFEQIGLNVQQENVNYTGRLKERMNDSKQRATRANNQFQMQIASVEGLKAEGKARSSGQSGRSAGKSVQAAFAENGVKQAYIAEQTTQAGDQYALTAQQNVNSLDEAYKELFMSNNKLDATRASLKRADIFARADLTLEFKQANADALNKIMLMPELAPELPVPPNLADYAAVIQDPYEYEAPPPPRPTVTYIPPANPGGNSFLNNTLPALGKGIAALGGVVGRSPNNAAVPDPNPLNDGAFSIGQTYAQ